MYNINRIIFMLLPIYENEEIALFLAIVQIKISLMNMAPASISKSIVHNEDRII